MQIIQEGKALVTKLWGEQVPKDTEYRMIRYHLQTECEQGTLLHNVITGELVLLEPEENAALLELPTKRKPVMDELIRHRFLVPMEFDEYRSVKQLRRIIRAMNPKRIITGYTILPTTGCNARCFYCYESNFPRVTMTQETAGKVAEYISTHCGGKEVSLHWFGGEPLVGRERIDQICRELQEKGIQFTSRMTSNAYLFSPDLAKHAREHWNLRKIQITLDGTEEIYNRTKAYTEAQGSPFRRVLANIKALTEEQVNVTIRLNLGMHNRDDLTRLVNELSNQFGGNRFINTYVDILFEGEGFDQVHFSALESEVLERSKLQLDEQIEAGKCGYSRPRELPGLEHIHCMADGSDSILISPDGSLGRCEHAVFENLVGSIDREQVDQEEVSKWQMTRDWPECIECCLMPKCVALDRCEDFRPCHPIEINNKKLQYWILMKNQFYNRSSKKERS